MSDLPVSVFISYSRTDSAFIDRMEADLRAYDFDTWVDRQHLEGGADWARLIETEILKRETLVVALSPDAVTSTWVRREITFALNAGKRIIPIIVRPVERVPIEIIEKQYIDLHSDYLSGVQELRVALLKTRTLPAPPAPAHAPQPLLAMAHVTDPLKGLVQIPAPPPAPNPDLNAIFMQAQASEAHGNLDLTEALLRQIVEQQSDFGFGLAVEALEKVRKQLEPKQIERLRKMADDAWQHGAWGQAIGALRALMQRLPQDGDLPNRLAQAENCQKWAWLYDNARNHARSGDESATAVALRQLWEKAPVFGDPSHIAPKGVTPPGKTRPLFRAQALVDEQALPGWLRTASSAYADPSWSEESASQPVISRDQHLTLTVLTGMEPNRVYIISKVPFTIGRSRDADLFVEDLAVSKLHTSIFLDDQDIYCVRDENSANGTNVNGKRISQQRLHVGDVINSGQFEVRVGVGDGDDQAAKGRNIFRIFTN